MSRQRYLIDTNVFFGLEDDLEVAPNYAALSRLASKHNIEVLVHEASIDDINQDKLDERKRKTLSKANKYQKIPQAAHVTDELLQENFGKIKKRNDRVDSILLFSLEQNLVDFLVTEDKGIHDRVRKYVPNLVERVLFVADAALLLKTTYEPSSVPIRAIDEYEAHCIQNDDPIFESLREDYPGFDEWWSKSCVAKRRNCWTVSDNGIAGIIVRKDETPQDTDAITKANKILKICTFKVRPENRGVKLGELLLKQVFWYAQKNSYDLVYLTTYAKQTALIQLIEYFGFTNTGKKGDDELIYEKSFSTEKLNCDADLDRFIIARTQYPRFCTTQAKTYGIPIKEAYHDELFPELTQDQQQDFFTAKGMLGRPTLPGNTIRKVYLCRAPANIEEPGSILLFYKGKSLSPPSQSITAVGIFESMEWAHSTTELMRLSGGRSVYSERQLIDWKAEERAVKVINFLLMGYTQSDITISMLKEMRIFKKNPPQSIFQISEDAAHAVISKLNMGFEL